MRAANLNVERSKRPTTFGGKFEQIGRLSRYSVLLIACTLGAGFCEIAAAADRYESEQHDRERLYGHLVRSYEREQRSVFGAGGGIYLPSIELEKKYIGLELLGRLSDHLVKDASKRRLSHQKTSLRQVATKSTKSQPALDLFEGKSDSTTALPPSLMPSK